MDSGNTTIGRVKGRADIVRRLAKWKRRALSRLSLHYPSLLRFLPRCRPLPILRCPFPGISKQRDLLVCLPGIGDHAQDFEEWGFVELAWTHRWAVDVLLVDAHYGYYADRTIIEQLHCDVFVPASTAGYRSIWLTGISLGGLGALLYAKQYEGDVTGVVAMAPFLGTHSMIEEIVTAGGLARWNSSPTASDEIHLLWKWLQTRLTRAHPTPDLFLAFGENDQFAPAHRLLATAVPDSHVFRAPGGHRWPVWRTLWTVFLDRQVVRRSPL